MNDTKTVISDADQLVAKETESLAMSARAARQRYEQVRGVYEDFARSVASVLETCLEVQDLTIHSITSRAKDLDSFERKAARPSPNEPLTPKYGDPMEEITDKAGIRITTYFLNTVEEVSHIVETQFNVIEKSQRLTASRTGLAIRAYTS